MSTIVSNHRLIKNRVTLHHSRVISFSCISFSEVCLTVSMHECNNKKIWIPCLSHIYFWKIFLCGQHSPQENHQFLSTIWQSKSSLHNLSRDPICNSLNLCRRGTEENLKGLNTYKVPTGIKVMASKICLQNYLLFLTQLFSFIFFFFLTGLVVLPSLSH